MIRRLALLAAAVAVGAPAFIISNVAPAGATFEFGFSTHETNFEAVIGGHATLNPTSQPGPGDTFIIRDDILQNGANVGFDNVLCTVTFNDNVLCHAVFAFTNKGDITVQALVRGEAGQTSPKVFDVAVTGGTFAYRNAHGDAHAVATSDTDTNWTVNFVTQ
jgi:hypothetical protein